jgi:hypothetical protein
VDSGENKVRYVPVAKEGKELMKYLLIAMLTLAPTTQALAAKGDKLLAVYDALNIMCRGSTYSDEKAVDDACAARGLASDALKEAGYCFKGQGGGGYFAKCR